MHKSIILALFAVAYANAQSSTTESFMGTSTQGPQASTAWPITVGPTSGPTPNCGCSPQNIWLDIFFAIDSSDAMTSGGLDSAMSYILSALARMTIGQQIGQYTRVGFIFYSANTTVQSDLRYFNSTDSLFDTFNNPSTYWQGDHGTNIEGAIKAATTLFDTNKGHRANTKRVLVILASSYTNGDYHDPIQAATTFKNDGGKIIAIEYVQVHGAQVPNLRDIASPGYFLSNSQQDLHVNDLIQLFCYANCFCTTNYLPYGNGGAYDVPMGGCYYAVTITSIERLTETTCFRDHLNGTLPVIEDVGKSNFINNLFASRSQYWIGLKRASTGSPWQWVDGSSMSYQSWGSGEPSSNGNCVMATIQSGFSVTWYAKDCTANDYMYACQTTPCSTDKYCTDTIS